MKASADDYTGKAVLSNNIEEQALPRLHDLKKKVDTGGKLSEADIIFMSQVSQYAQRSKRLINRLPEWNKFFTEVLNLHGKIIDKALDNVEKR